MNDFWNDPPEDPELPLCPECGSAQTDCVNDALSIICHDCGFKWIPEPDPQPTPEDYANGEEIEDFQPPEDNFCRHGNKPEDCDACFYESDLAYDAQREKA